MTTTWDDLTTAEKFQHAGNLDPWVGPVDPVAQERQARRIPRQGATDDACGCWANDCAECGPRRADGHRPAPGAVRRHALQAEAALQDAKNHHAAR